MAKNGERSEKSSKRRSYLWALALVGVLIGLIFWGVYLVGVPKVENVLTVTLMFGAIGGITHDIVQNGGSIELVHQDEKGIDLGSFAGVVLGIASGFFVAGGAKVSAQPTTNEFASLASEAFVAGLALRGVGQAVATAHAKKTAKKTTGTTNTVPENAPP